MMKKRVAKIRCSALYLAILWFSLFISGPHYAVGSVVEACFTTTWPHEKSDLLPDPSVVFGKLENNFRYVIKYNDTPRDRVAIYLNVQVGSIHEEDDEKGYAHFLEHMLFNGSTHFPPGMLIEYFQEIGMEFGADINAYVTYDETVYMLNLPAGEPADLKKGFLVMSDYAEGALLLPEEVDKERKVILAEKLARDSVAYRTQLAATQYALRGTKLAERPPIGTEEAIRGATSESLRAFYDKWYRPENMILFVVGDVDPRLVENEINTRFAALQCRGTRPECPQAGTLSKTGLRSFYFHEPEAGNTDVAIESYFNKQPDDDSYALQVAGLREYIATSILQKRFERFAEENVGLMFNPAVYAGELSSTIGYSGLSASTSAERWADLLPVLENGLRQALEYGITQQELELAKRDVLAFFSNQVEKTDGRQSTRIMRELISTLNNNRVFQSAAQERALYTPAVQAFTTAEIDATLKGLFQRQERLLKVTGDAEIYSETPQKTILDLYATASKKRVTEYIARGVLDFPYLQVSESGGTPIEHERFETVDVDVYRYANGTVLNLKRTEFRKNEVNISIEFGSGELEEPLKGMGMMAARIIRASGTGRLTESQLADLLSGTSVNHTFGIDETRFKLQGNALASEVELLLQTLRTILMDPGLRSTAYENVMLSYEQMYKSMESSIRGAEHLAIQPFLAGDHPLFGIPPMDQLQAIELELIEEWVRPIFADAALEISIVGDFEKELVLDLISKYFGTLPARSEHEPIKVSVQFSAGEHAEFVISSKINQGLLVMAWQTTGFQDIRVVRRLNTLAAVVEERIRLAIREQLGATYSPTVYNSSSRFAEKYGKLYVRIVTDPDQLTTVQEVVRQISKELIEQGVSQEELARVSKPNLTSLKDLVQTNGYWLNTVLAGSSRYPEQLRWSETIIEDHAAITAAEISAYGQKYLQPERLAVATVRPTHRGE